MKDIGEKSANQPERPTCPIHDEDFGWSNRLQVSLHAQLEVDEHDQRVESK